MEDFTEIVCDKCDYVIDTFDEDTYQYHSLILCEDCLFQIFLKEHNFDKRITQDDLDDDDFFIWDRFRENHLKN